jgi:hypothetical protein
LDRHINTRALESRSLGEGAARNACMHGTTCMPLRPQLRSDQMASWAPHAHTTSEGVRHSRASPRPAPPSALLLARHGSRQMLFFFNVSPRLFFFPGSFIISLRARCASTSYYSKKLLCYAPHPEPFNWIRLVGIYETFYTLK